MFALNLHASQCKSLLSKATTEYQSEQYENSYKIAQDAIKACRTENIQSAPVHVIAGASKLRLGQFQLAVNEFLIAEKIDPKSEIIQYNLCSAYGKLNDEKNTNKYCGINEPPPIAAKKQCHYPKHIKSVKEKFGEYLENCNSKPNFNLQFSAPECLNDIGGKSGSSGGHYYILIERFEKILNNLCAEKPDALARIKTITYSEAANYEALAVKDVKSTLNVNILVGYWNEHLILNKITEIEDLFKDRLRQMFGVKLKTEEELNIEKTNEENASNDKKYDEYNTKYKALKQKQNNLIEKKNKIAASSSAEIAKIWSSQGDMSKKSTDAQAFQLKTDKELEAIDKEIQNLSAELDKLSSDYDKSNN